MIFKRLMISFLAGCCLWAGWNVQAEDLYSRDMDQYRFHFSTFNSTFVSPQMARIEGLKRGEKVVLVNVAITEQQANGEYSLGKPASEIRGEAKNLMGQKYPLNFKRYDESTTGEQGEQKVTYYLATLEHIDEEVFHFLIRLRPESTDKTYTLEFSRKLYIER